MIQVDNEESGGEDLIDSDGREMEMVVSDYINQKSEHYIQMGV